MLSCHSMSVVFTVNTLTIPPRGRLFPGTDPPRGDFSGYRGSYYRTPVRGVLLLVQTRKKQGRLLIDVKPAQLRSNLCGWINSNPLPTIIRPPHYIVLEQFARRHKVEHVKPRRLTRYAVSPAFSSLCRSTSYEVSVWPWHYTVYF